MALALVVLSSTAALTQIPARLNTARQPSGVLENAVGVTGGTRLIATSPEQLRGDGPAYRAWYSPTGMRFEPALGDAVASLQHLSLTVLSVQRGERTVVALPSFAAPRQQDRTVVYAHSDGAQERYEVREDGVALSWLFHQRPEGSGDLVVRYSLQTSLPEATRSDTDELLFASPQHGGVAIGTVTGIDAAGNSTPGSADLRDGVLELSLPAAFVDAATYPLVLDPVIGPSFGVGGSVFATGTPDVAYDESSDRFLVVWRESFSLGNGDVRARLVNSDGTVQPNVIVIANGGSGGMPQVANYGTLDRFGVVYHQGGIGQPGTYFAVVDAYSGAVSHQAQIVTQALGQPRIGSEPNAPLGSNRAFVLVYDDTFGGQILAQHIYFNAADQLVSSGSFVLWNDGAGIAPTYSQPRISRAAGPDRKLLVVVRRQSGIGPSEGVRFREVDTASTVLGAVSSVHNSSQTTSSVPVVDGYAGKWVIAWQQQASGSSYPAVWARSVTRNSSGTGYSFGAVATFGGTSGLRASDPVVAYAPGRTWLAYFAITGLVTQKLLYRAVDSGTCTDCQDVGSINWTPQYGLPAIASMTSGGFANGEDMLLAFPLVNGIWAQRLRNYGLAGTSASLGGGCGGGGTLSYSHAPGIGSSGLVGTVSGLSNTALLSVFNLSSALAPLSCGTCQWLPFQATATAPILAGSASFAFAIPCLPALIGTQVYTQWTSVDLGAAPCGAYPGLIMSDIVRLTIGP
tara:strand:- start:8003 stop:10225 length:2223 start_codon:yes stop_codon:yes gene_type:complete